eukprot:CAMPEP_0172880990 /NCGR_PEP_ID=MMETSP1075-20121228/116345_1 /TAXON_ID=2916 /ORGANISM="Ceratium fusus, Strain PA161109" /LENGTH=97 /DNA_ID=CAMNT_0013733329 /DNA_START=1 /DNA_END=290 /DNA_ORIENTATION=+
MPSVRPMQLALLDRELPIIRSQLEQDTDDVSTMGTRYPGGDVMNQSLWRKHGGDVRYWPPEERNYRGARLGEYARQLVTNKNVLGLPLQAPVPLSAS